MQTEKAFRRFEPLLLHVVNKFPEPVDLSVLGLSAATVVSRIREAARGFIINAYPSAISHDEFCKLWPNVSIVSVSGRAIARPKRSYTVESTTETELDVGGDSWTDDEVKAVALLLSTKKIQSRVEIKGGKQEELENLLGTDYDVAVFTEGSKVFLI